MRPRHRVARGQFPVADGHGQASVPFPKGNDCMLPPREFLEIANVLGHDPDRLRAGEEQFSFTLLPGIDDVRRVFSRAGSEQRREEPPAGVWQFCWFVLPAQPRRCHPHSSRFHRFRLLHRCRRNRRCRRCLRRCPRNRKSRHHRRGRRLRLCLPPRPCHPGLRHRTAKVWQTSGPSPQSRRDRF